MAGTTINATMECGECTACCKFLPINDGILVKEENKLCTFCERGCTIYDERPESCVNFNCVYITDGYDKSLRPDKTGVIFDKITTKIYYGLVGEDYLDRWDTIQMRQHIKAFNEDGISIVVSSFSKGIMDIFCSENHNKDKVMEIALGYTY